MDTLSRVVFTSAALMASMGIGLLYYKWHMNERQPSSPEELRVERLATPAEQQRCIRDLKQNIRFKDEQSLRIEGEPKTHYNGDMQIISLSMNGKNSYGGYTGPQDFGCFYTGADHKLYAVRNYSDY